MISLVGAEARRRLMHAQLDLPDMPPHRVIDAVDGRALDPATRSALYDDSAARQINDRALTLPEIGCALSHLSAYRHMQERDIAVAVVLEDDALLGHQFLKVLERLVPFVESARAQAILLSHVGRYSAWGARRVDKTHELCRPYVAHGAHAYLITLAGAKAMLAALEPVRVAADDWHYFMRSKIVEISAVIPYIVGTAPLATNSQIGNERFAQAETKGSCRWARKFLWRKFVFQLVVKPLLRLKKHESSW